MFHRLFHRYFFISVIIIMGFMMIGMHLYSWFLLQGIEQYSELLMTLQLHGDLFLSRVVFGLFDLNSVLVITVEVVIYAFIKVIQSWTWLEMGLLLMVPYHIYHSLLGTDYQKRLSITYTNAVLQLLLFQVLGVAIIGVLLAWYYGSPALLVSNIRWVLIGLSFFESGVLGIMFFRWLKTRAN